MNRILSLSVWTALLLGLTACNKPADSAASSASDGANGTSSSGGKKRKIAFVSNGVASFWTIASAGVKAAGEKFGVDAQTLMPVEGISDQKRMIEDLLTKGVDGIAVSPIDPANQTDLLNTAARRAKVLTHDSDAPNSDRLVYIGMDNYKAGRMCGDLVREAMPKGGTVMIFIGRLEQDNSKRRRQGTIDAILGRPENPANYDAPGTVLEGNGFKILGTLTDQFDRAKGKANAEDALAKYPDLNCRVGLFAYYPPLLLETSPQTSDYTLVLGDAGRVVVMNRTTAAIVTVPLNSSVAFFIGSVINIYNMASTAVTIAGASDGQTAVTIRNNSSSLAQYQEVSLRKRGDNEWVRVG